MGEGNKNPLRFKEGMLTGVCKLKCFVGRLHAFGFSGFGGFQKVYWTLDGFQDLRLVIHFGFL